MISVYDCLAKVIYDNERNVEYKPWTCINDDNIAQRINNPSATPVLYAFIGTARQNSEIAVDTRTAFTDKKIDLLVPHDMAVEEILPKIKEYASTTDADEQIFFETPYLETIALIHEMINLQYEKTSTGVRLSEKSTEMKDRYVSLAMGVSFAYEYERNGIQEIEEDLDYGNVSSCVSILD